jgi:hypothetical protein
MDPRVGRFSSTDPFAGFDRSPVSLHQYLYANADPATLGDPTGRFSLAELRAVGGTLSSLASTAIPNLLRLGARVGLRAIGGAAVGAASGAGFAAAAGDDVGDAALFGLGAGAVLGPIAVYPGAGKLFGVAFTGLGSFAATTDALEGNYRRAVVGAVTVGLGFFGAARAGFVRVKSDLQLRDSDLGLFDAAISALRAKYPPKLGGRTTVALSTWEVNGKVGQGVAKSGNSRIPPGFLRRPTDPPLTVGAGGRFHAEEIILQNLAAE